MASEKEKLPSADSILFAVGEAFTEILRYGLAQLPAGVIHELNEGLSQGKGRLRFIVEMGPAPRVACEFVASQPDVAPVSLFEIIGGIPFGLPN